jgi:hypothetical protein
MDDRTCAACGVTYPRPPYTGAAGYALLDPDAGRGTGRVCYSCADSIALEDAERLEAFTLYLSGDGRTLTTWTGGPIARVTGSSETAAGFCGRRIYFRARTRTGRKLHGSTPGRGMFARVRAAKS